MDNLPKELQNIIFDYVDGDVINPIIENILENNLDKIDWRRLCKNKNSIHIIEKIIEEGEINSYYCKIDWIHMCYNEKAIYIREKNKF